MKSSNEKIKDKDESREDSEIMSNKIAEDFSQEIDTDKDYKRTSSQKKSLNSQENARIIPPPGLPDNIAIP